MVRTGPHASVEKMAIGAPMLSPTIFVSLSSSRSSENSS